MLLDASVSSYMLSKIVYNCPAFFAYFHYSLDKMIIIPPKTTNPITTDHVTVISSMNTEIKIPIKVPTTVVDTPPTATPINPMTNIVKNDANTPVSPISDSSSLLIACANVPESTKI